MHLMSKLSDFLINEYPPHFGVTWNYASMFLRSKCPSSICFEIEDKKDDIVQPHGEGVSVIRRSADAVEVIDLENYTKTIHGTSYTPSSCDFAISPAIGTEFIIFNELTKTESRYIRPFTQPSTGIRQEGKLEYARKQLQQTILRFYSVSDFCDQYNDKIALFSCRLSDKPNNGIMARSAKSFNRSIYALQKLQLRWNLPNGFKSYMRIYKEEYRI